MLPEHITSARTHKSCPVCCTTFRTKPSHYDKKTYCSRPCMAVGYQSRMKGDANPNYRDAATRTCKRCGGRFESYQARDYCSVACRAACPAYRLLVSQARKDLCGRTVIS